MDKADDVDDFAVVGDEFSNVATWTGQKNTAVGVSTAKNVANISHEEDAAATETLVAGIAVPTAGAVDPYDEFLTPSAGPSFMSWTNPPLNLIPDSATKQ